MEAEADPVHVDNEQLVLGFKYKKNDIHDHAGWLLIYRLLQMSRRCGRK